MKKVRLIAICFFAMTSVLLQAQTIGVWKKSKDEQVPLRPQNERRIVPLKYDVWKLDFQAFKAMLNQAPMEMTESSKPLSITLPLPDGKEITLDVKESPIAHPDLMAKYPSFKTFYGVGGRNKEYAGRFDYTVDGFRAAIDTPEGEVYIDPYATEMQNYYVVYYIKDYQRVGGNTPFRCGVIDADGNTHSIPTLSKGQERNAGEIVKIRKFRLAMGSTGEFTNGNGGTKEKALARIVALTNRTTKVTMKEAGVRFELIANTDTLIWMNPATDPFPVGNLGKDLTDDNGTVLKKGILSFAHNAIRQLVGINNFDVGHIVTLQCSDVGGVVGGQACSSQSKGSGVTCDAGSVDQIAISIMAHEMGGHQYTGSHTMSSCSALPAKEESSQVGSSSKIEPGSGSTVMSYDGSCGPDNITGQYFKSEGYYSVGTIGQIWRHVNGNSVCGATIETTNHYPVVTAAHDKKNLVIPRYTPFELTAKATDADGDNLTYSWEQSDEGGYLPYGYQNQYSNNFRVFNPVTSPTRTFPRMDNIVKGKSTKDELYPDTTRKFTFVCVVRDNNPLVGGTTLDTTIFRTTHTAGPFAITFPNAATDTASAGDYMNVKWNVARTDNALVNCQYVNILLSTDGGYTYPRVLLKNTPNDGEEGVILPQGLTSNTARIRINPVENIFFDISNKDFKINASKRVGYTVAFNTERKKYCIPEIAEFNIQSAGLGGFDKPIALSVSGLPQGATAKFDTENLTPNQSTRLLVDLTNVKIQGDYTFVLRAIAGTDTLYRTTIVKGVSADFSTVGITIPANGATAVSTLPSFKWTTSPNAETYDLEIATNPSFEKSTIIDTKNAMNGLKVSDLVSPVTLLENQLYYVRVRAVNNCKAGEWGTPVPFHTLKQICNEYKVAEVFPISSSQAVTVNSELTIAESGIISDVNVNIKGTHTSFGHLQIRLISPTGKESLLSDKKCPSGGGANLNLRYDDQAAQINKCDKLLSLGTLFRPETPLANLNGENTKGKWTLQIKDLAPTEGGALNEWSARFCASSSVKAPEIIKNDTLKVRPNKGSFINNNLLYAIDDKANAQQLTFTLVTLPQNGIIERWGGTKLEVGTTFSQSEINQAATIRYVHGNNTATSDYFLFVLTDGEGGFVGTLRYNIVITPNAPISSTQDAALANAISVFPNPTANILNVSIYQKNSQNTKIQLFSVNGQQVAEKNLPEGEISTQLETGFLPEGIYLLKVSNFNGFATKRVVIQR